MEAGNFRCEPNLSLRPRGSDKFGSKVEIKNLNSFRAALRGMEFEVERQTRILNDGGHVASETRGWREETQETASQRSKEQAHDYRYFPEPDLPPLAISREKVAELRARLPELPDKRRERFMRDYSLTAYEANLLTESRPRADYFEAAAEKTGNAKLVANWLLGDLSRLLNDSGLDFGDEALKLEAASFATLLKLVEAGSVTGAAAKEVLREAFETGADPEAIVSERGLGRIQDEGVVAAAVTQVLAEQAKAVADYRAGKVEVVKFLVGQVMKATRGRAAAAEVQALLQAELDKAP
jgi:aspartyl-tRNA(Asn)/glutamyl-tRNA(Gln) amidotransferase subunit B